MKILITGATGQLGHALQLTQPQQINSDVVEFVALNRNECNLENKIAIEHALNTYQPNIVINTAAYTAVDKAESESAKAQLVNADAVKTIAQWCQASNAILVHISTDFVFDGKKSTPYLPGDSTHPCSVYGASKRDGEIYALEECESAYVIRTGWVYSEHGSNFVKTILRLASEREHLGIIADQIGTPTYARNLAKMIWKLLAVLPKEKLYHFSDAGVASWYDFAVAIVEEANRMNLLKQRPNIKPITTQDYPTPAQRPAYSVLNKTQAWQLLDIEPQHWRHALVTMLSALQKN